jgi:hypothetical protein
MLVFDNNLLIRSFVTLYRRDESKNGFQSLYPRKMWPGHETNHERPYHARPYELYKHPTPNISLPGPCQNQ